MSSDLKPQDASVESDRDVAVKPFGWRRLQAIAAIAALVSFVAPMVIFLSLEPFFLAMAAPFAIGLMISVKWPRVAAIWLGLVSLAVFLFSAPFLADALTHPESVVDFLPLVLFALATLVGTLSAIPALREIKGGNQSPIPRRLATTSVAFLLAATAWSVAAFTGLKDTTPQPGDILVATEDFAFVPIDVTANAGTITVAATNHDNTRHTFSITELGVELSLPPGTTQRVSFNAEPGTYTFFCNPHPDMQGKLVAR
jgi:plastocyanin